jgi:hypothetical protein
MIEKRKYGRKTKESKKGGVIKTSKKICVYMTARCYTIWIKWKS